jgi:hypothetical protein
MAITDVDMYIDLCSPSSTSRPLAVDAQRRLGGPAACLMDNPDAMIGARAGLTMVRRPVPSAPQALI